MTGKIVKGIAGFYYVHDGKDRVYECKAKGVFRNKKIKPLVGDNVEWEILSKEEGTGNITAVLERTSSLIRPAVANADQALVVFAVTDPEPNLNLLDRFLVMLERQALPVHICFNKADLGGDQAALRLKDIYSAAGYDVHVVSARDGAGMETLKDMIRGKTTVLAGPSGVGKSSITNLLYPEAAMETGAISEKIRRGKHTTRHSELFFVGDGAYLMDTPGFSSMYMEDMEAEDLKDCFPEFIPFEGGCRFLGCVHMGEKICGIKAAVAAGKIYESRYENYRLFYSELKEKRRYGK